MERRDPEFELPTKSKLSLVFKASGLNHRIVVHLPSTNPPHVLSIVQHQRKSPREHIQKDQLIQCTLQGLATRQYIASDRLLYRESSISEAERPSVNMSRAHA